MVGMTLVQRLHGGIVPLLGSQGAFLEFNLDPKKSARIDWNSCLFFAACIRLFALAGVDTISTRTNSGG